MNSIDDDELLARFIVSSKWYRADLTIKPDAFIPHPTGKLSVTKHSGISESKLWEIGKGVAASRQSNLHGRSDILAGKCKIKPLQVVLDEPPENHVHIENWPEEKHERKMLAIELAKASSHLIKTGMTAE